MRKLNRIILINAAGFDYVEFPVGGHSQVIGVNGHGKSTLLRTVLFFYLGSNEKAPYALHETKMDFVSYYLGNPPSYLVYEVSRGNGEPHFHIAVTRPSGRIQFQFIDAPFNKEYFVDGSYVRPMEEVLEALREAKCPSEAVTSYDEFNHRIYGVVSSPYSVFRPAPRSSGHVGILARIISGIFTVSQLDADKFKSALTCGVRQDSLSTELDLALLKGQLQNFRRVNNAVRTYIRYENEASELVNLADQFEIVKSERQHAIEDLVRMAKKLPEEVRLLAEQQNALETERSAAIEQFNLADAAHGRAIQGLGEQIAVRKSGITKGETTVVEYQKREIDPKSKELEKLPALTEERRVAQDEYDILTAKYSTEQEQKSRLLATVQQSWTEISRQLADKRGVCERESRQNLESLDKDRRHALTAIAEERKEAKAALMPRQKAAQINRATLNREFQALADIKEPAELAQIRKSLEDKDRQQRDEANRQDQLRTKIAAAKLKAENDCERLERDAELERGQLGASIKQLEVDRDRIANELEKFDLSLARFFQIESPQTWPDAAKTLSRDTLFQSAEDLAAKKSKGNSLAVWGVELSAEGLRDQHESYNRETLAATLQKARVNLANEHDKLEAARTRYLAASSELDKQAVQTRTGLETDIAGSLELRRTLLDAAVRLDNRRLTLESQFADDKKARRDKLNSREEALSKEEGLLGQEEAELDARWQGRETKVNEDFDGRRKSFADDILHQIATIEKEERAAGAHRDEEKQRIEHAFQQKLTAQGVSSKLIQATEVKAAKADGEIQRISNYQAEVIEYLQLKREYVDPLPSLISERDQLLESLAFKNLERSRLGERHAAFLESIKTRQDQLNARGRELEQDAHTAGVFQKDPRFSPELGYFDRDDLAASPFYRAQAVTEFFQAASTSHESLVAIGKNGDRDAKTFLNHFDAETLDRKVLGFSPIHAYFDWFIFVGSELKPFLVGRRIQGMKQIQTQEFEQLIRNIRAKNADFQEGIRQVNQTAALVEQHLKENNFVDVLDSIELKVERVDINLTRTLAQLEEFADVTFSAERDLFGKRADRAQIDRAIETFEKLLREIDNHRNPRLQLTDYFDFVIRVHENGHDMGWRRSLDHIGSTGTDYLVKMLIYLSLIEIYRERAIDAKSGSIVHCILDETGVLAPKYVRSVLDYAKSRGIILITAGHSQQTIGFENWMHVRKCGQRFAAQTVLRKVLKCD